MNSCGFLTPGAYQVAEMSAQPRRRPRRRSVKPPIRYQQATQTSAVEQRRLRVALANSKVVKVLYDGTWVAFRVDVHHVLDFGCACHTRSSGQ